MVYTNPTAASAQEIAAIFEYTFFNGASLSKKNSYNTHFRLRYMVKIFFSPKCQFIRKKKFITGFIINCGI